ncbi:hypothetical protein Hdeb2414_s0023g00628271 [Helianthus debilis subsp. tardiflorus]
MGTWIKGIGGGGKSTLARAVFDYISTGFEVRTWSVFMAIIG